MSEHGPLGLHPEHIDPHAQSNDCKPTSNDHRVADILTGYLRTRGLICECKRIEPEDAARIAYLVRLP